MEVEEIVKHMVQKSRKVEGFVIFNVDGIVIRTNFSQEHAVHYVGLVLPFWQRTLAYVAELNTKDDKYEELQAVRLRSRKHEIIVTQRDAFIVAVVQRPEFQTA